MKPNLLYATKEPGIQYPVVSSPVLTLDPGGQELPQLHGEAVAVQVVELLQVPGLQLLQLVPLRHPDRDLLQPVARTVY